MHGLESTQDAASQALVGVILVGVFALLAADRMHRVLVPIGAVALLWSISYLTPYRLISFEAAPGVIIGVLSRAAQGISASTTSEM